MLTAACPCGFTVDAETREEIVEQMMQHAKEVHPGDLEKMAPGEMEKKLDEVIKEKP